MSTARPRILKGAYIFRDVDPGRYIVTFQLSGFNRYEVPDIILPVGRSLKVDAKMTVGGTEQTIGSYRIRSADRYEAATWT